MCAGRMNYVAYYAPCARAHTFVCHERGSGRSRYFAFLVVDSFTNHLTKISQSMECNSFFWWVLTPNLILEQDTFLLS